MAKEIICAHNDAVAADAFAGTLLTEEQSLTKSGDPPIIANTPSLASVVPAGEESITHKICNFSVLPVQVQNRAEQGYRVPMKYQLMPITSLPCEDVFFGKQT